MGSNGIINTEKNSTTYRIFMGYSVIKSTLSDEPTGFIPLENVTKNSYQNWTFVSKDTSDSNINWKQELHVFSLPQKISGDN